MSDDRSPGQIVPTGWRLVLGVVAAVLLLVGVGLLLARVAGFGEVRDAIEKADSTWFVVCLGAQLVALGVNALFYVVFGIGAWTAALVTVTGSWGDLPTPFALPWLVVVPAIAVAAVVATQHSSVERLTRPGGALARRALAYAVAAVAWARSALVDPAGRRMLGATVLFWIGNLACLWASLRSVGETISFPELALAFAAGYAAMILPLPLGGVGGVDAAITYALTVVGVPLAPALVAVGVYRLFSFWLPTAPALVTLLLLPRSGRRLAALP